MSEASETVFLHHLTDRLKWSVLDAPSTVQVLDMDENNEPQYIPLFGSPPHALAALPITSPARSCMLVFNALVECSEYWQDSGDPAPAPLVIENLDGRPISVAQFITELHDYTLRLRDLMYEIEDRAHEEEAVYTFFRCPDPSAEMRPTWMLGSWWTLFQMLSKTTKCLREFGLRICSASWSSNADNSQSSISAT
jgi:hypothetical protein